MIEVRHLSKHYGTTRAVEDLSFRVRPGEVTGFLGPNGAGKSTTMRMILGLDRPTSGEVLLDGRRYHDLLRPLCEVGALVDPGALHPARSARTHLRALAASNRIPARRVGVVLEQVGLASVAGKPVGKFSLGMTQRLGIAAALLGDPPVLLFDEPVNGLDPEGILWVRTLLCDLASEGRTVFYSSHLMSEMAQTATSLVVIGRGRLIAETTVERFITDNTTPTVRARPADPADLGALHAALHAVGGATVVDGATLTIATVNPAEVGRSAHVAGIALAELRVEQPSLEDVFMNLTACAGEYRATLTEAPSRVLEPSR